MTQRQIGCDNMEIPGGICSLLRDALPRHFVVAVLLLTSIAGKTHSAPPRPIDLDDYGYSTPRVRESLERFLDTARETAGDDWTHRILATSADRRNFISIRCKRVDRLGQCLIFRPANVESVHGISVKAIPDQRIPRATIRGFWLEAHRQASPKAWAVGMNFHHFPGGRFFQLQFTRNQAGGRPAPEIVFPVRYFDHVVEFEEVAHEIRVALPDPHMGRDWDAELPKILLSPETFRDAILADLDQLEQRVEKPLLALRRRPTRDGAAEIVQTQSRRAAKKMLFLPNEHLDEPNFGQRAPRPTIVTDSHRRQVLELVRAWIRSRRVLVRDNADVFHREVIATFPIAKCLVEQP